MPSSLVLFVWFVVLLGLLIFDPARDRSVSVALWIPVMWIVFVGSRQPSVWLAWGQGSINSLDVANAFEEGDPVDRVVWLLLIVLAIGVLLARSVDWSRFVDHNYALIAFVLFCLLSVAWSDFPLISFKRWFRDLGNYLVVLVILSDPRPELAVRSVLRRACYLWIPLSIVVIKYSPELGKGYDVWTGEPEFRGVAASKNILGVICLVSTLFFVWDTLTRWSDRKRGRMSAVILVNVAFLTMTLWLLLQAGSATATVCLALGISAILATRTKLFRRRPGLFRMLIPVAFSSYLVLAFALGMNGQFAEAVGRDSTLTSRTTIWNLLLSMHTNPWVGVGYDSFWEGSRLAFVWANVGEIGEAHNGFLEVYLNLGIVGLTLLFAFFVSSYRQSLRGVSQQDGLAPLTVAFWAIMPFYNVTEAAVRMHLIWVTFLIVAIRVCTRKRRVVKIAAPDHVETYSAGQQVDRDSGVMQPIVDLNAPQLAEPPEEWDYRLRSADTDKYKVYRHN